MDSRAIIEHIRKAKKVTPCKAYIQWNETGQSKKRAVLLLREALPECRVFDCGSAAVVFGEYSEIEEALSRLSSSIQYSEVEASARNSALPLLDIKKLNARIEPGAIIREYVSVGEHAVIMMGAIINIGAVIGARSMIDMGAVLGGRAVVGRDCHIGAGAVLAGVIEPESACPVIVEDEVFVGANAVVIEGCRIGKGSVIGAGTVVTGDIPPHSLVVGVPGRIVKTLRRDETVAKDIIRELREL